MGLLPNRSAEENEYYIKRLSTEGEQSRVSSAKVAKLRTERKEKSLARNSILETRLENTGLRILASVNTY